MTVLANYVTIENEDFVLIGDITNGQKYYGTIPYSEIDKTENLKRELNGLDICISFLSAEEAIEKRKWQTKAACYKKFGFTNEEFDEFLEKAPLYL